MQRALAVAVVVVAVLAFLIFLPAVRGRLFGIPLKWNYRVGQAADYNVTLDAKYSFDSADVPAHLVFTSHLAVRKVEPDGSAAIEIAPEGGQMKTTVNGNETTIALPRGKAVTYTYDTLGNLLSADGMGGAGPLQPLQLLLLASDSGCASGRRTRPGGTWVAPLRFDVTNDQGRYTYEGKASYTFVGLETRHHTSVAHVHGDFSVRLSEQPGDDAVKRVIFSGTGKGTCECYIDYKNSYIVGYEVKASLDGAAGGEVKGQFSTSATYAAWMQ